MSVSHIIEEVDDEISPRNMPSQQEALDYLEELEQMVRERIDLIKEDMAAGR